ncbi:hypothetical protein [Trinickia sp.]|uniref:hypothetical protein n=1 Tax=Trinickia sp. TaxID=2571163 RepID=UPI003F8108B7
MVDISFACGRTSFLTISKKDKAMPCEKIHTRQLTNVRSHGAARAEPVIHVSIRTAKQNDEIEETDRNGLSFEDIAEVRSGRSSRLQWRARGKVTAMQERLGAQAAVCQLPFYILFLM